jgi:RNA polymerase sigma-70 factor (ECF subfamily)
VGAESEQFATSDAVIAIYHVALPQVYGYLLPRCRSVTLAEDLTAETFMAAVAAARQGSISNVTVAWLVGVARHKLADHWRRLAREERYVTALEVSSTGQDDPWEDWLGSEGAHAALGQLSVLHRLALTLRYIDGLHVAEVAEHLDRSVHATETVLVRARAALRRAYREEERHG